MLLGAVNSLLMLRLRISENTRWYLLGSGLAMILVVLGILQYRDNRQLRWLLQQQMSASLHTSLMRVRFGVEQQLTPICNLLEPSHLNLVASNLQQYATEFAQWRSTAVHPDLVSNVFLYVGTTGSGATLFQLKPDASQFKPVEWPADFATLRAQLDRRSHSFDDRDGHGAPFGWYIDENIPALVHLISDAENIGRFSSLIVQLNAQELTQHILPELAQRDLNDDGKLNYQVALTDWGSKHPLIYTSDAGFGVDTDLKPDVQLNMFGPPVIVTETQARANSQENSAGEFPVNVPFSDVFRGRPDRTGPRGGYPLREERRPVRLEPIRDPSEGRGWTLVARHRKGSVEAAVAALYRNNLTISLGVLIVLAGTLATMFYSVRRAQQLAKARMDFVANVSHELRTPLTGIVSAAQNIADGLIDNKERTVRYGSAILGQAQQLSDLIEQILLFSATEKGRYLYHFDWVDVPEAIEAAIAGTSSLIRSSGARIEQTVDPNLPRVWCDSRALTQCLQNLIMNSIKYGGDSRWVGICAQLAGEVGSNRELTISVEDKGVGISREDLQKIFQPFYRSSAVTRAQIHGSGLGLPIAKSISEAMGGTLTVESELGKGSKFSVHLPAEGPLRKMKVAQKALQSQPQSNAEYE
jgi:signal transduction histidine kinase